MSLALDQDKPISDALWTRILDGRKVRYLVRDDQVEWAGKHARFCLSCGNCGKAHGDPRRAWCDTKGMMTGNTFPVLCRDYK